MKKAVNPLQEPVVSSLNMPHEPGEQASYNRWLTQASDDDKAFSDFLKARLSATQCSKELLQKIRAKIKSESI
jgi:hypothetical protein